MVEAGFLAIHQVKTIPWQKIDGIQFLSITLTGYKCEPAPVGAPSRFATLTGPFSKATDELGQSYRRGVPQPVDAGTARMLSAPPLQRLFVLSESPTIVEASDPRWVSVLPEQKPGVWKGDFAIFAGPFAEVEDDDHHVFRRGVPLEICSKTLKVLAADHYRPHFAVTNRASDSVSGTAVSCAPEGGCC
jgi:hypothetical protein